MTTPVLWSSISSPTYGRGRRFFRGLTTPDLNQGLAHFACARPPSQDGEASGDWGACFWASWRVPTLSLTCSQGSRLASAHKRIAWLNPWHFCASAKAHWENKRPKDPQLCFWPTCSYGQATWQRQGFNVGYVGLGQLFWSALEQKFLKFYSWNKIQPSLQILQASAFLGAGFGVRTRPL